MSTSKQRSLSPTRENGKKKKPRPPLAQATGTESRQASEHKRRLASSLGAQFAAPAVCGPNHDEAEIRKSSIGTIRAGMGCHPLGVLILEHLPASRQEHRRLASPPHHPELPPVEEQKEIDCGKSGVQTLCQAGG